VNAADGLAWALYGVVCLGAGAWFGVLLGKHVALAASRRSLDRVAAIIDRTLVQVDPHVVASERSYGAYRNAAGQRFTIIRDERPARGSDADLRDLEPYDQERPQ
jgi:hypothetical protein